jgi:branched-chain amino acid transport system permease protein
VTKLESKRLTERAIGVGVVVFAVLAPTLVGTGSWIDPILTRTLIFGLAAASLIFLSAYGGMISLTQTALMGIAGYAIGNMVSEGGAGGESKGLALGWDPTVSVLVAVLITVVVAFVFGAIASRSYGIYFLMLTLTFGVILNLFFGSVTKLGGFSPIAGIDSNAPDWIGNIVQDRDRLYYIALGCALVGYALIRFVVRTPFGLSFQGIRDEPVRMASLGYAVPLHRMLAFTFAGLLAGVAGVLAAWYNGQISPSDLGLNETIALLVMAVIGGLSRIEGAFLGAFAYILIENKVREGEFLDFLVPVPFLGGTFTTVVGFIFLAIVVVSPDGLMGIWERLWSVGRPRRPSSPSTAPAAGTTRAQES